MPEDPLAKDMQAAIDQMEALERRRAEREGREPPTPSELAGKRARWTSAIQQILEEDQVAARGMDPPNSPNPIVGQMEREERAARLNRSLARWNAIQARGWEAADWVDQHVAEVEQASTELHSALLEAAIAWLGEKWGYERPCPYCGNQSWTVGVPVNFAPADDESLPPHFPVMCDHCGNTAFINAIHAGLLPEPDE